MLFILAFSRDGGKTWSDELHRTWKSGQKAQEECQRINQLNRERAHYSGSREYGNHRYRVRQLLDTEDTNFYAREAAKGFTPLDFDFEFQPQPCALVHINPDNPKQVRFFDDVTDAIRCHYTVMNLTRFLSSYMGENDNKIQEYLVKSGYYSGDYEFKITGNEAEILWAYENGPTSCMNDPDEYPLPNPHPCVVYAESDLAVAVIKRGDNCTARAVVWPEKKIYAKVYGHDKLLTEELEKAGYHCCFSHNRWRGARIRKIWDPDGFAYLMPYIDMAMTLSKARGGNYFRLNHIYGPWCCRRVDGYTEKE